MTQILLTAAQSGFPIEARVGDELVLQLVENPTTGYRWQPDSELQLPAREDHYVPAAGATGAGVCAPSAFYSRAQAALIWPSASADPGRGGPGP